MEKQALAVREQQWYQTITTAKQSGQSIKSWCAENGVPLSSFYSWQRKMRSALLRQESVQFEELPPSSPKTAAIPPTQITLHIRDVTRHRPWHPVFGHRSSADPGNCICTAVPL